MTDDHASARSGRPSGRVQPKGRIPIAEVCHSIAFAAEPLPVGACTWTPSAR